MLMYAYADVIESYRIWRHKRRTGMLDVTTPSAENIQEKVFHLLLDGKSNISLTPSSIFNPDRNAFIFTHLE